MQFANIQTCNHCAYGTLMQDVATVNRRLELLAAMQLSQRRTKEAASRGTTNQKYTSKVRELTRKVAHFSKQIEANSRDAEDLVTQTKLMMRVRSSERVLPAGEDTDRPGPNGESSPSLLFTSSTPNNFSSVESLQRYISQGDSGESHNSQNTYKTHNPNPGSVPASYINCDLSLEELTDKFNRLMQQLQNDRSLSDTHVREQLLDVASRIKVKKNRIINQE